MDTRKIEGVPFEEVHEIQRYGTYFSEKSFWKKIERVAKKVGATVLRPVFTDDVAVMTFVLKMVKDSITPEIRRKADQKILDLFPDPA